MADPSDARSLRRQQVHAEVRGAAVALMTERGFDGVTVEEIAASTSVSPSTIYRHFGTKEAMVLTPGRPLLVVRRVASDSKRADRAAIRRATNRVYGKSDGALAEMRLVVGEPGLRAQFDREWAMAAAPLSEAFAARRGEASDFSGRASAAAVTAVLALAICEWASESDKLGPRLDAALDTIVFPE